MRALGWGLHVANIALVLFVLGRMYLLGSRDDVGPAILVFAFQAALAGPLILRALARQEDHWRRLDEQAEIRSETVASIATTVKRIREYQLSPQADIRLGDYLLKKLTEKRENGEILTSSQVAAGIMVQLAPAIRDQFAASIAQLEERLAKPPAKAPAPPRDPSAGKRKR